MENKVAMSYLDNAATSPMPDAVLQVITDYYQNKKVNVHRGMYQTAYQVTQEYEKTRKIVQTFIHAPKTSEIIFTSGTTDALNMVAFGYALHHLQAGDEIMVSVMEHHSNYLPWQVVAQQTGATLKTVKITEDGFLDMTDFKAKLSDRTRVVALTLLSNVLGTKVAMTEVAQLVHQQKAVLVVDAAQAVVHFSVDVTKIDADFLAFSGHKMFGPTGIGVLYGKKELLEQVQPVRLGGEMALEVSEQVTTYQPLPLRLEAGTPNVAGVLGLGAAIRYLNTIGWQTLQSHEQQLMQQLLEILNAYSNIKVYGPKKAKHRYGVISFNFDQVHAHDVATILDTMGVAVRAGHMCAEPLMHKLAVPSVVRVSISHLTTDADLEKFADGLQQVGEILQ